MKKILLKAAIFSTLLVAQTCLGANYTAPTDSTLGKFHFNSIQVAGHDNVSAELVAKDKARIYSGQAYTIDLNKLGAASSKQDAVYNSLNQLVSQGIKESFLSIHDVSFLLTNYNPAISSIATFTIIKHESRTGGVASVEMYTGSDGSNSYVHACPAGTSLVGGGASCKSNHTTGNGHSGYLIRSTGINHGTAWYATCSEPSAIVDISVFCLTIQ